MSSSAGKKYPLHPLCLLFPIMPEEELIGLAEDIRRRGLLEPIMLLDGQVLDGRHRLEACRRAGVKPRFVHWKGDDSPLEWAVSKNMRRRQFNAGQRAVLALEVLPMLEKEAWQRQRAGKKLTNGGSAQNCADLPPMGEFDRGKAAEHAARLLGASTRYVEAAKRVRRICPDMLVHVLHGKISLFDAQLTLKMPCTMVQGFLDQLSQMRPGDVFPLKRIVREHLARAINAGADFPNPCWGISLPEAFNLEGTADWHEVRYIIWNKQIAALDNGEEIPFPIAGRPCLVRVNPNPTTMEAATARGDLILPE